MGKLKHISQCSLAMASWIVINFINFFQLLYQKYTVPNKFEWSDLIYYPISSITIGILLIYLFLLPVFKIVRKQRVPVQIVLFILHGLLYSIVFMGLTFLQIASWSEELSFHSFSETVREYFATDFHNVAKNYFILLAVYIAVEYINKRVESMHQKRELEEQLHDAKLQALESKMHPHFLFNALNGIAALINEAPRKAENAIVELSDLLRFALEGNLHNTISLEEELTLLGKYISIEKMRYEDQLKVSIEVEKGVDTDRRSIPPLILQPVLENSIIHGFRGTVDTLKIYVVVGKHRIAIKNNGAPLNRNFKFNTGLRIVEQRLQYYNGSETCVKLYNANGYVVCELNGLKL